MPRASICSPRPSERAADTLRLRVAAARGFTLTEILVVVSILAMLATAASIQLLRARIVAHEQVALNDLRQIARACHFFNLVNQRFPADLTELANAVPPYIPPDLAGNGFFVQKRGYSFTYARPSPTTFSLNADPITAGVTGTRYFYVDENLAIHVNESGSANATDPVIP